FDQKDAGGNIPGIEIELPVAIKTSACGIGEIKSCRTGAPNTMRVQRDLLVEVNVGILVAFLAWEAGSDQALTQCPGARHVYWSAIQLRSAAAFNGKKLVARWVINHACDELCPLLIPGRRSLKPERDTENRKSVSEVRRPVQRINVPVILSGTAAGSGSLFTHDVMIGEGRTQAFDNQFF